MALNQTIDKMKGLLAQITQDIAKSEAGNKAASQRVRTGTVRLEKVGKLYRKESIKFDKTHKGAKKPAKKKAAKKAVAKKAVAKKAVAKKAVAKKKAPLKKRAAPKKKIVRAKARPKATKKKAVTRKTAARARTLSLKRRPTAKLPARRRAAR